MSKQVIIEMSVKEGALERLLPFLSANLPNVRGFTGCLNVTIFLDRDSGRMIFDEEWLSRDAHRQYISAIAENGVMDELVSYLVNPPEIKYFNRLEL